MDEYEEQANKFLKDFGLKLKAVHKGDMCPPWKSPCDHMHGDRHEVTISRADGKSITFDFWNSVADVEEGKTLTNYSVLACISSDAQGPTNPDEVYEEFGDMKPSQAIAISEFAKKLQAFFTEKEIEALSEIQ